MSLPYLHSNIRNVRSPKHNLKLEVISCACFSFVTSPVGLVTKLKQAHDINLVHE